MTKEEFEALGEYEKETWIKEWERVKCEWEKLKPIRNLPYPFNYLHTVFPMDEIDEAAADYFDEILSTLAPDLQGVVTMLMRDGKTLDDVAEKYGVMPFTVWDRIVKSGRLMRNPSRFKKFNGTIRIAKEDEE